MCSVYQLLRHFSCQFENVLSIFKNRKNTITADNIEEINEKRILDLFGEENNYYP